MNDFASGSSASALFDGLLLHLKPQLSCTFVLLYPYGDAKRLRYSLYWILCAGNQNASRTIKIETIIKTHIDILHLYPVIFFYPGINHVQKRLGC